MFEATLAIPDISLIATCEASSFSFRVADSESGVMPEVFAAAAAWVSVSAAPFMAAKKRVLGRDTADTLESGRNRCGARKRCIDNLP